MSHRPIITLTTDFGAADHFVGAVKGVILNIVPDAEIVDITHSVAAFDVLDGAITFAQAYPYFPPATVHMVVVDPGVGSARRPIVVASKQYSFVAPDNGVLSFVYGREERAHVFHASASHYYSKPLSQTFHARDIFAPIAGYLAKGVPPEKFGDEITDFMLFEMPAPAADQGGLRGKVLKVDRFGNLITNITSQHMAAPTKISVAGKAVSGLKASYSEGAAGEVFGIWGSMGFLDIAANCDSAAQILGAGRNAEVVVS